MREKRPPPTEEALPNVAFSMRYRFPRSGFAKLWRDDVRPVQRAEGAGNRRPRDDNNNAKKIDQMASICFVQRTLLPPISRSSTAL